MIVQRNLPEINITEDTAYILAASDFHFPFQDNKFVETFIKEVENTQPNYIILNGDLLDFYMLSRFSKSKEGRPVEEEIEICKEFLQKVRLAAPEAKIYYVIGNHETRLEKYTCDNAPDIASMVVDFYEMLDCKELDIIGCAKVTFNNEFYFEHGTKVSQKAGMSAMKELEAHYMSGATGHTHRAAKFVTNKQGKRYVHLELGCGCNLNPLYAVHPDWCHAFGVITFRNGKLRMAEVFEVINGEIMR